MPLTPFIFEYQYNKPHEIAVRSIIIAASTYSFSTAFATKFRVVSVLLIVIGFVCGGMYGAIDKNEIAVQNSLPCIIIYFILIISTIEWAWRHFLENEECLFYTIFQKNKL